MTAEQNVFIVNRDKLIQTAIEMERQETLSSFLLMYCIEQLEDIKRNLEHLLTENKSSQARGAFLNLFLTDQDWGNIITDKLIEQWESESHKSVPRSSP